MHLDAALSLLGLDRAADEHTARSAYRRRVRELHPDLAAHADEDVVTRTERTASLNAAWTVVQGALHDGSLGTEGAEPPPNPEAAATPTAEVVDDDVAPSDAARSDRAPRDGHDGTLWLNVPADEAYLALYEAGGRVGHIAYVDRHLGLLEVVVRFEGGPTCSVLITLQGRAEGTEAMCTMTSIEASPAPSIDPVLDALADALTDALLEDVGDT